MVQVPTDDDGDSGGAPIELSSANGSVVIRPDLGPWAGGPSVVIANEDGYTVTELYRGGLVLFTPGANDFASLDALTDAVDGFANLTIAPGGGSGRIQLNGNMRLEADKRITQSAAPTIADHLTNRAYVDAAVAGVNEAIYDHFQSALYATGPSGILFTNEVPAGDQGVNKSLSPNGAASWSNGFASYNPSRSALIQIEMVLPALAITPPVDGTLFSFRRTATMTVGDKTDVAAISGRNIQHDAAKGQFYIPKMILKIDKVVNPGAGFTVQVNEDADFDWSDAAGTLPLAIYPQSTRAHGYVSGRLVP